MKIFRNKTLFPLPLSPLDQISFCGMPTGSERLNAIHRKNSKLAELRKVRQSINPECHILYPFPYQKYSILRFFWTSNLAGRSQSRSRNNVLVVFGVMYMHFWYAMHRHLWWCLVGAITILQCIFGALFLGLGCNIFLCCVFGAMRCQLYRAFLLPQWCIYFIKSGVRWVRL